MTADQIEQVCAVLNTECGNLIPAAEVAYHWPECREYRFCGHLGFGGKLWFNDGRIYVSCYSEDETPSRRAAIDNTNRRLAELQEAWR